MTQLPDADTKLRTVVTLRAEQEWRKHSIYAVLVLAVIAALICTLSLPPSPLHIVLCIGSIGIGVVVLARLVIIARARKNPMRQSELTADEVRIKHGEFAQVIRLSDCRCFLGSAAWDIHGFLLPYGEWFYVRVNNGPCFAIAPAGASEWQHAMERLGVPFSGRLHLWRQVAAWIFSIVSAVVIGCIISTIAGVLVFQQMIGKDELAALVVSGGVSGVLTWSIASDRRQKDISLANSIGCGLLAVAWTWLGLTIAETVRVPAFVCSVSIGLIHFVASRFFRRT